MRVSTRRAARRPIHDERGDTLVEVLASLVLMSTVIVAILGALFTLVMTTEVTRDAAAMDTNLGRLAETVQARTGAYAYRPCTAASAAYPDLMGPSGPGMPPGWTARITKVRYWDGVASSGTKRVNAVGWDVHHQPSYNYFIAATKPDTHTLRFVDSCPYGRRPVVGPTAPNATPTDYGIQEITIEVVLAQPAGRRAPVHDTITFIKRNPACPDDPTNLTC